MKYGKFLTLALVGLMLMGALPLTFSGNAQALIVDDWEYVVIPGPGVRLDKYTGTGGVVDIPGTINGIPVVEIGNFAFQYAPIVAITFPETLTAIGDGARAGRALYYHHSINTGRDTHRGLLPM
jgi:hypothetical protein